MEGEKQLHELLQQLQEGSGGCSVSYQQGDDRAGVVRQILNDFGAAVGSDAQGSAVNLFRQHRQDFQQEGQRCDIIAVPEPREGKDSVTFSAIFPRCWWTQGRENAVAAANDSTPLVQSPEAGGDEGSARNKKRDEENR